MKRSILLLALITFLGTIFLVAPKEVEAEWCPGWGPGSSCEGSSPACGSCACEGWASDHNCSGCGHTYCKKEAAGCGGVQVCDATGYCCWIKEWSCGCFGGPGDGDGDGDGGDGEQVVGRVWKGGAAQSDYSISSADGKTASWGSNEGGPYYMIGRWSAGSQVTITLNNPGSGYTCTWSFDNKPNEAGGEASGPGCSATVTIGSGSYSPDWQNHLHFALNQSPSCSSLTVPQFIRRGETVNIEITGADPEGRLDRIEAYYSPTSTQSWTNIGSQSCSGSSCTRTFSWDTSTVSDRDYYVVGNVYDTDGGKCSGNPWTPLPSGWSSCPNCRKTVTIFTPRTWTIQYEAVCANGMEPTGQTRSVYGLWPPNPLVWHYGSYGDAGAVRSQTITNEHPWNNIYFWMQTSAENALPLYGAPPHSAIHYGTYFSPPTPMAEWKWNALPEGTYKINFLAPDTWCSGSITGKIWNDESNVGGTCEMNVSGKPAYTGGEATVTYSPCSTPPCATVSDSSGNYRFDNVPIGGYQVSISFPSGSSWFVTSQNPCPANIASAGDVGIANFGVSNNPLSWFQGINGDIYGNGITAQVPSRGACSDSDICDGYNRWFLDADPATTSGGVVISGTDTLSCGGGISVDGRCSRRPGTEPGWRVTNETMGWPSLPSLTPSGDPISWDSLVPGKVYSRTSLSPSDHYDLTGPGVAVIYVRGGDLNFTTKNFCSGPSDPITGDCISPDAWKRKGLIFIVEGGNVTINQDVRRIDALILVVSGTIRVEGTNVANNLNVRGMLYAQNNINFARTLENNRIPSVVVRYNPLYLLTNPFAKPRISWREVAP